MVTLDAKIVDDLGFDSLDNIETIMEIEDLFGIEIDDNVVAEEIKTVRHLVDTAFILRAINSPAPDTTATEPLNANSVRIYIDNTIQQKRAYQGDKTNGIMAREKAKHQVEVLQVMREELFGSRLS